MHCVTPMCMYWEEVAGKKSISSNCLASNPSFTFHTLERKSFLERPLKLSSPSLMVSIKTAKSKPSIWNLRKISRVVPLLDGCFDSTFHAMPSPCMMMLPLKISQGCYNEGSNCSSEVLETRHLEASDCQSWDHKLWFVSQIATKWYANGCS